MTRARNWEARLSEFSSLIAYSLPGFGRTQWICKQNCTRLSLPITDSSHDATSLLATPSSMIDDDYTADGRNGRREKSGMGLPHVRLIIDCRASLPIEVAT